MWEKVDFNKVVKDITGGNGKLHQSNYQDHGRFPIVDQGEKFIGGYYDEDLTVKLKKPVVIFGDHSKCLKYIDFNFILGADGVKVLEPSEKLNSKFLFYFLKTVNLPSVGYSRHFKYLKETKIPLPPLPVQQRIADMLDKADALRRKDQELLKKYDELAQAIFIDMFGDPVKNEKGWEVKKLGHLGIVVTGNTPPRKIKEYYGSFLEWIKTDNIILTKTFPERSKEFLSEEGMKVGRHVPIDSILVTCIAGSKNSIGNCALTDRKVAFNQQINAFVPDKSYYNPVFLYNLFRLCKTYIQNSTTDGMKKIITKSVFEKLLFVTPPIHLQKIFAEKIELIDSLKGKNNAEKSEALFQSLLQRAFRSELVYKSYNRAEIH